MSEGHLTGLCHGGHLWKFPHGLIFPSILCLMLTRDDRHNMAQESGAVILQSVNHTSLYIMWKDLNIQRIRLLGYMAPVLAQ